MTALQCWHCVFRRKIQMTKVEARTSHLYYTVNDERVILDKLPALHRRMEKLYSSRIRDAWSKGVRTRRSAPPTAGPFHLYLSYNWNHGQSTTLQVKRQLRE